METPQSILVLIAYHNGVFSVLQVFSSEIEKSAAAERFFFCMKKCVGFFVIMTGVLEPYLGGLSAHVIVGLRLLYRSEIRWSNLYEG